MGDLRFFGMELLWESELRWVYDNYKVVGRFWGEILWSLGVKDL